MHFIRSPYLSPYYNLAAEEYLLKTTDLDYFMIWESSPCIVVGKHQNTYAETNYPYVLENNMQIARRLSGGGTVYHGRGNINFTFIVSGSEGKLVDFKKYLQPIVSFLKTLHIDATIGEKNDVRISGLKISGNAEHVYRKRTLHHGTLLFNADLKQLNQSIFIHKKKYTDKAVQSNRAVVTNIADHLMQEMTQTEFENLLIGFLKASYPNSYDYTFGAAEKSSIEQLVREKYNTPEWIFGYSPKYQFGNEFVWNDIRVQTHLIVEKGRIVEANIHIGGFDAHARSISNQLIGVPHLLNELKEVLHSLENKNPKLMGIGNELLMNLF